MKQGRGEMHLAFFEFFFAFLVSAKNGILLHFFLHVGATSAKERVSQRVVSCSLKTFHTGAEAPEAFFFYATW